MLEERIEILKTYIRSVKASIAETDNAVRMAPDAKVSDALAIQRFRLSRQLENLENELKVALAEQRRRQDKERNPDAYHD